MHVTTPSHHSDMHMAAYMSLGISQTTHAKWKPILYTLGSLLRIQEFSLWLCPHS